MVLYIIYFFSNIFHHNKRSDDTYRLHNKMRINLKQIKTNSINNRNHMEKPIKVKLLQLFLHYIVFDDSQSLTL